MRSGGIAAIVVAIAVGIADPAAAADDERPFCVDPVAPLRLGKTRSIVIACDWQTGARLLTPPDHADISNVSVIEEGVQFDARPHDDTPRLNHAVFEIWGPGGAIELTITLETIPNSENAAPVCFSRRVEQRSDGNGPVTLVLWPQCYDPDGDAYVMDGAGPGLHLDAPRSVAADERWPEWPYRTATFAGDEHTTMWATDELGARSADASIDITVGPDVDHPPECDIGNGWYGGVRARPGVVRRFGIWCSDRVERDPVEARISSPPARGALVTVPRQVPGYPDSALDATYTPFGASLEPDPFSVATRGPRGDGPTFQTAIVPIPFSENGGGGCSVPGPIVPNDRPTVIQIECHDSEGDALSHEVVTAPRHGTAIAAAPTPLEYGDTALPVTYVPDRAYEGYDTFAVNIHDDYGFEWTLGSDIMVEKGTSPLPEDTTPPVPGFTAPPPMPPPAPSGSPLPPGSPAPNSVVRRALAERALGTTRVKRLSGGGGAEVWARSSLSRRDLLRYGRAPGIVVVCLDRCQVKSDSTLKTGTRSARLGRTSTAATGDAGQTQTVQLGLDRRGRAALRRARKPVAKFTLSVRSRGKAKTLRRSIPIRR
jgi:hypothetical protein